MSLNDSDGRNKSNIETSLSYHFKELAKQQGFKPEKEKTTINNDQVENEKSSVLEKLRSELHSKKVERLKTSYFCEIKKRNEFKKGNVSLQKSFSHFLKIKLFIDQFFSRYNKVYKRATIICNNNNYEILDAYIKGRDIYLKIKPHSIYSINELIDFFKQYREEFSDLDLLGEWVITLQTKTLINDGCLHCKIIAGNGEEKNILNTQQQDNLKREYFKMIVLILGLIITVSFSIYFLKELINDKNEILDVKKELSLVVSSENKFKKYNFIKKMEEYNRSNSIIEDTQLETDRQKKEMDENVKVFQDDLNDYFLWVTKNKWPTLIKKTERILIFTKGISNNGIYILKKPIINEFKEMISIVNNSILVQDIKLVINNRIMQLKNRLLAIDRPKSFVKKKSIISSKKKRSLKSLIFDSLQEKLQYLEHKMTLGGLVLSIFLVLFIYVLSGSLKRFFHYIKNNKRLKKQNIITRNDSTFFCEAIEDYLKNKKVTGEKIEFNIIGPCCKDKLRRAGRAGELIRNLIISVFDLGCKLSYKQERKIFLDISNIKNSTKYIINLGDIELSNELLQEKIKIDGWSINIVEILNDLENYNVEILLMNHYNNSENSFVNSSIQIVLGE